MALLQAAHAGPALAVTAIATALTWSVGDARVAGKVAAAVAAGQLSVGWTNDYLDCHRDVAARRTDKPIATGALSARVVRRCATVALAACVPLSIWLGWRAGVLHLFAVASAMAYNTVLKATPLSFVPYVLAFGNLPSVVTLSLPNHPGPPWWAVTAAASLGVGAHLLNALPDLADDVELGVLGLPQRLGPSRSIGLGVALLAGAMLVLTFAPRGRPTGWSLVLLAVGAAIVGGVIGAAVVGRTRLAWLLTICSALAAVALFLVNGRSLV